MSTVQDDIVAAQAADAALAAANAAITPAQQADQAADALVVADLTAAGVPVLIPQADGVTYSVYTLAPGSPGYAVTSAKLASSLTSSAPAAPTPTPTPTSTPGS